MKDAVDPPSEASTHRPGRGAHRWVLLIIYLSLILGPLGLVVYTQPIGSRPVINTIASAMGLMAFAICLVEFLFSGRHRWISGRIGLNGTMRIHRWAAYAMVAFILIHPFLYTAPDGLSWPWFAASDPTLPLNGWSLLSGFLAWILTAAMIITAVDRRQLPWTYETWQTLHASSAVVLGTLITVHSLTAEGYSSEWPLAIYWLVLLAAGILTMIHLFLLRPWQQRRSPFVVETVDKVGERTWTLSLRPDPRGPASAALRFRPGQFVWLKVGKGPFSTVEHPFSISTAPTDAPIIGFTIRETGDFTNHIGEITRGTRAYLDGPHGHLIPDEPPTPTVYIVGGSGISPVLSHLHAFQAAGDRRSLTLIYSVRSDTNIPNRIDLERMATVLDLTLYYVVQHPSVAWRGPTGRLDEGLLHTCIPEHDRIAQRYFLCGPPMLVKSVHMALRRLNIPRRRIISGS